MKGHRGSTASALAVVGASLVAAAGAYRLVARPWHLRWGATDAELARRWPGDELLPRPRTRAVRALTIAAPPERVWPWIMQVGRDRGGFYSYTWLENLIGADIHNVDRLIPGLEDRRPGDTVWMGPEDRFGGQARMVVASRSWVMGRGGAWLRTARSIARASERPITIGNTRRAPSFSRR